MRNQLMIELVGKDNLVKTIEIYRCDDRGFYGQIGDYNLNKMAKNTNQNGGNFGCLTKIM